MRKRTVEEYLQTPYRIIDILPERVPENSGGQVFAIEKYWRSEPNRTAVKQKHVSLILKLNCYRSISLDEGKTLNPSPDRIAEAVGTERAVIMLDDSMIIAEPDDHYMTLYHPDEALLNLIRTLAAGEGLYVW